MLSGAESSSFGFVVLLQTKQISLLPIIRVHCMYVFQRERHDGTTTGDLFVVFVGMGLLSLLAGISPSGDSDDTSKEDPFPQPCSEVNQDLPKRVMCTCVFGTPSEHARVARRAHGSRYFRESQK